MMYFPDGDKNITLCINQKEYACFNQPIKTLCKNL